MNDDIINYEKIQDFLSLDNLNENISVLILKFAKKSQTNVKILVALIPAIANASLSMAKNKENDLIHALEDLIHASEDELDDDITPAQYVVKYWRAVKEFYPNAKAEAHSPKAKEFFNIFVHALKLCEGHIINGWWATDIVECNNYLKKILENNP